MSAVGTDPRVALEFANTVRDVQARAVARVASTPNQLAGRLLVIAMLEGYQDGDVFGRVRLWRLVRAIPHVGQVRSRRVLNATGIYDAANARVCDLDPPARDRLIRRLREWR